jgi:hypothetical protein
MWQSHAFGGAFSLGGSDPREFGTAIWACVSRDAPTPAAIAAKAAFSKKVRRVIPLSLVMPSSQPRIPAPGYSRSIAGLTR